MPNYQISQDDTNVSIELKNVGGTEKQIIEAFGECKAGRCSCPTDEYEKLASMDVQQTEGLIKVRLQTKPGQKLDTAQVAACLDHVTETVR